MEERAETHCETEWTVDSGHGRSLIRTIRGTGYQIGANCFAS